MSFKSSQNVETDFTKKIHRKPYGTISVSRPDLSQAEKTTLITGGATGIGFNIAKSFIEAAAARVIITGRRHGVLDSAGDELRKFASQVARDESATEIVTRRCDQTEADDVKSLWTFFHSQSIDVDVLVLNAASFAPTKPILDIDAEALWSIYQTNVYGPLLMVKHLERQPSEKRRVVLNVSTQAINMLHRHQLVAADSMPAYGMTKNAGTMLLQQIAKDVTPEKLQIINFHPGLIHNDTWESMGVTQSDLPFDDAALAGSFAVWATTLEAAFLHGRFVWSSWDIDEYSSGAARKRIDEDPEYLKIGIIGLSGAFKA